MKKLRHEGYAFDDRDKLKDGIVDDKDNLEDKGQL